MDLVEHFAQLFAVSLCAWGLYAFYISFRIRRFIIKRYEEETDLLNTIVFKEHATFTRYLPNLFSSVTYTVHLLICVWGWRIYRHKRAFRDIKDPSLVTRHFSPKEIRRVKWFVINGMVLIAHGVAYLIFRSIWPEAFN